MCTILTDLLVTVSRGLVKYTVALKKEEEEEEEEEDYKYICEGPAKSREKDVRLNLERTEGMAVVLFTLLLYILKLLS